MKKYKFKKTFTFEGKRYYVYADSLPEVYEKMGREIADLESGKKTISKNMRFEDWTDEWLKTYKEPTVSHESFDSYRSNINVHILPLLGSMPIKSIKAIHCQRVINNMSGMSKKMISRINELMFSIFEDAVDNGLAVENPARKLKLPKGSKTSRRAITPTERKHILKVFESHHRAELWLSLMLYCGLRPSEAAALQWKDINIQDKILTVNQAAKRRGTIGSPKTEAGYRKIPIPDVLMEKLHPGEPFEYVCKNTQGTRLTSNSMQKMWDSFKNALNIEMGCKVSPHGKALPPYRVAEDLVPYCLRHTYCTDLRDAGVNLDNTGFEFRLDIFCPFDLLFCTLHFLTSYVVLYILICTYILIYFRYIVNIYFKVYHKKISRITADSLSFSDSRYMAYLPLSAMYRHT